MIKKLESILNRPFVKNIAVLISGTMAAQAITLASTPFITRIYGPEAFGILGTFNAIISIVAPVAALTYPIAIVLPKSDKDAKGLIKLSLVISIVIASFLSVIFFLFNEKIVSLFGLGKVASYLYLIPLVVMLSALMQVSEQWLIRKKQFSINAKASFIHAVVINISKIIIGFFKPLAGVLIIIQSLSSGIKAVLMMCIKSKRNMKTEIHDENSNKSLMTLAKENYDFPAYRAPQVLLNGISLSMPVLMLSMFFGPFAAGYYTLSRTVLSAPTQLLGKSVSDVFYPRIADAARNHEDVTKLLLQASISLFAVGILPFGSIIIFGPSIFKLVFGLEWTMAGEYARWTALWVFWGFVNRPSVMTLPVLSAQAYHLIFTVIMLLSNALMLFVGFHYFSNDIIAIMLVGISGAVFSLGLIVMTLVISKRNAI